jgi:transcriptional regulator with XRE-family HTH domain
MTFGERVKLARDRVRMTQGDLAEKIGMHRVQISRWHSAGALPGTVDVYKRAAEALGVNWLWLMEGVGPMRSRKRKGAA